MISPLLSTNPERASISNDLALQEVPYIRGRGDFTAIGISLVINVDGGQIIEVVDHDSRRLLQPLIGGVTKPVEAFYDRAIA